MAKQQTCCPDQVEPERGARAHTFKKTMPVSHGEVIDISHNAQFVKVRKEYGRRCKWSEWFPISEVHIYAERKGINDRRE